MVIYKQVHGSDAIQGKSYYFDKMFDRKTLRGHLLRRTKNALHFSLRRKIGVRDPEPWLLSSLQTSYTTRWIVDPRNAPLYEKIPMHYYKQKLKEKFEENVLKFILKRIVNEDFEWR